MAFRTPLWLNTGTGVAQGLYAPDVLAQLAWTYLNANASLLPGGLYAADSSGGALTLTLPALAGLPVGTPIQVGDIAHSTNIIKVVGNGSDEVDGYASPNNYGQMNDGSGRVMTFVVCSGTWRTLSGG